MRDGLGEFKFLWVIKELEGKPNDRFLHLLTQCRTCGQTNRTGIVSNRAIIYHGNRNNVIHYKNNSWNRYTETDLKDLGINFSEWGREKLTNFISQGISIPQENDVKKLKIVNCRTICINCGGEITFNASDCFI